jgi:acetyltransferase-like isoleucine patch superfamily enzyme
MKKLIAPILFLFSSVVCFAQADSTDYYNPKQKLAETNKVSTSISAGTSVAFLSSTKTTAFTTFVAPAISYQVNSKFKLNLGLMHYTASGNTFMPLNQNEFILNTGNNPISGNVIFASGNYLLTPKLMVTGGVMVDANTNPIDTKQNNYKAATMGFDYKISEHSTIGIHATVSQGGGSGYYMNSRPGNFGNVPNVTNSFGASPAFGY